MHALKIGELAARSGLAPSKIRFYEAQGLLPKVDRRVNGYREYPPHVIQVLEIISTAQRGGFSLNEIRPLLPLEGLKSWNKKGLLAALRQKVAEIENLQRRLKQDKTKLLTIIRQAEENPGTLSCEGNAKRVLKTLRE
jgi:DNA-binding transcriptional MerR regulator